MASLEQTPEVASVSRVQISTPTGERTNRNVRVWITAEAWQVKKKAKR